MRFIQTCTGIAACFALVACAVQGDTGPVLPDSRTALITANADMRLWVGVGVPGRRMTNTLRLPPGYSCVKVAASFSSVGRGLDRALRKFELCFEANAGKTYEVMVFRGPAQPPRRRWRIQAARIEDVETGEILDAQETS